MCVCVCAWSDLNLSYRKNIEALTISEDAKYIGASGHDNLIVWAIDNETVITRTTIKPSSLLVSVGIG